MPADGMPIVGFTPDAPGLYLVVMHAGVVMAPVVGRLATAEIVAGSEAEALAPCRLSLRIASRPWSCLDTPQSFPRPRRGYPRTLVRHWALISLGDGISAEPTS